MTNQNITSPALYHQNQPPDSGSVHESQRRKLWLWRRRSHRHTCGVCFCLECSTIFSGETRRSLYARPRTSSPQKFVSADDKSKHKHAQPFITRTNLLTRALYTSHSSSSFGCRCISFTAIHAVCVFVLGCLTFFLEKRSEASTARPPATKSPFLLMTNQNITSPALYHQNQPPDSGSVHESQQQQLWLSLHCIHRHTSVCVFVILQVEFFVERSGTTDLSPRPKIFVKAAI